MRKFWAYECQIEMEKPVPKVGLKKSYGLKVAKIKNEIRDGIIEKWLSYATSENLTEFIIWRLHLMRLKFTMFEIMVLHKELKQKR